jgi:hypothetical protein
MPSALRVSKALNCVVGLQSVKGKPTMLPRFGDV